MRTMILGVLAVLAAGCDAPSGPILITTGSEHLTLENATPQHAFYRLIEAETSSLIDWRPCDDPSTCSDVPPLDKKLVPYGEITGYKSGDDLAYLYWWYLVPNGADEFRIDSVRVLPILLGPRNLTMERD